MIIKIIASILVAGGCIYIGALFAEGFERRVKQLVQLQNALDILKFNISFLNQPLSEALNKASKSQSGVIEKIFNDMSCELAKNDGYSVSDIWERVFARHKDRLYLKADDTDAVYDFAKRLGDGDRENQLDNIEITLLKLKMCEDEARAESSKNVKMYRGLGFLGGILLVILLI